MDPCLGFFFFPKNMTHVYLGRDPGDDGKGGIRLVHGLTKSTLITYFSGMKIDPKYAFLHALFLNLPVMSFPKFVYMTKNTPFFLFCMFFKRCTLVHCLVLKNNPNYVNFWTSLIPALTFECPPPPRAGMWLCNLAPIHSRTHYSHTNPSQYLYSHKDPPGSLGLGKIQRVLEWEVKWKVGP